MADNKPTIVIKKKVAGGHAGAHGGAWKVAYADFVTAMMAFFLVMWLLGSDEETRTAVSSYFNNPTSIWRPDLKDADIVPTGDKTGSGESVMKGANGETPSDLVDRPQRKIPEHLADADGKGEPLFSGNDIFKLQELKFKVNLSDLFKPGQTELSPQAQFQLKRIGSVARAYKGYLSIKTDPVKIRYPDGTMPDPKEVALTRAVKLRDFFVKEKWIDDSRIDTNAQITSSTDSPSANAYFDFSKEK